MLTMNGFSPHIPESFPFPKLKKLLPFVKRRFRPLKFPL
jgi:hypothetical protein